MDWIWTETSMTLFEWLKMEDIFANIFELKCYQQLEIEFPNPRGESKSRSMKYLLGGCFLIAIIALVWAPIAIFSLGAVNNSPYEMHALLRIGSYEPVYTMTASSSHINP